MAVSDPYLARASPLIIENTDINPLEVYWHSCTSSPYHSFPETSKEFMNRIEYSDIGAIALALPMLVDPQKKNGKLNTAQQSYQEQLVKATRKYLLQSILKDYWGVKFGGNGLVCDIGERLSLDEARSRARENPDMWEEMEDELFLEKHTGTSHGKDNNNLHPSLHAAVALNQFLWHHTGNIWMMRYTVL
jgi:hypothetical protein